MANHDGTATAGVKRFAPRRLLRLALIGLISLAVLCAVADQAWKRSGSNEWKLVKDEAGVKLWTLKAPGSRLLQIKAQLRVKATMAGMIKMLEGLEACSELHCRDNKLIERLSAPPGHYAAYVSLKFDVPGIHTQEYVVLHRRFQDPTTRQVKVDLIAAPARLPRDECCVRITHMHNTWLFTPKENGEIDVLFTEDTDSGGLPYPVANVLTVEGIFEIMKGMQDMMDKPRYRVDSYADIKELGQN